MSAPARVHNHWDCQSGPCRSTAPLTLADRELIHGRRFRGTDEEGRPYCTQCLADLPPGFDGLAHICGEETVPAVGDLVFYSGSLAAEHGLYEVTVVRPGGRLRLVDIDRALDNVRPASVAIIRAGERGRS